MPVPKCAQNGGLDRFELDVESWKTFDTQPFCQLCIKYVLVFYKIDLVQFCNKYMVGPSHKNSFQARKKWKMNFHAKKMKTPLGNIV